MSVSFDLDQSGAYLLRDAPVDHWSRRLAKVPKCRGHHSSLAYIAAQMTDILNVPWGGNAGLEDFSSCATITAVPANRARKYVLRSEPGAWSTILPDCSALLRDGEKSDTTTNDEIPPSTGNYPRSDCRRPHTRCAGTSGRLHRNGTG